jgi:hypothetical protein
VKPASAILAISTLLLLRSAPRLALYASVEVTPYGHTAWAARDRFSPGNVFKMAQTPDGYPWFGKQFRLALFDSIRKIRQPPAGRHLPDINIHSARVNSHFRGDGERTVDSRPGHQNSQAQGGPCSSEEPKIHAPHH